MKFCLLILVKKSTFAAAFIKRLKTYYSEDIIL